MAFGSRRMLSGTDLRLGEVSAEHFLNYAPDATFASLRMGGRRVTGSDSNDRLAAANAVMDLYESWFKSPSGPAGTGRYYKETGASCILPKLPSGVRPSRATWTEVPCTLWFDATDNDTGAAPPDGWMDPSGDPTKHPENDRFGAGGSAGANFLRDVRVDLEVWDDLQTATSADDVRLASFSDPGGANAIPRSSGRVYARAVFVNEWNAATRANHPLDVTPFLDDVTFFLQPRGGASILAWEVGQE